MTDETRRRASHEGGHAAAAYAQGLPFRFATTGPVAAIPLHRRYCELPHWCAYTYHDGDGLRELLGRYVVTALAGLVAEKQAVGDWHEEVAQEDIQYARRHNVRRRGELLADLARAWETAERVGEHHWAAIEGLADPLVDQGWLTAREARHLLAESLPDEFVAAAVALTKTFSRFHEAKRPTAAPATWRTPRLVGCWAKPTATACEWSGGEMGDGPHVQLELLRGHMPEEMHRRPLPVRRRLSAADFGRVRRVWLCLSVDRSGETTNMVTLQGTPVAEFPTMIPRYHHRSEISAGALPLLGLSNELRLAADASDEFRVRA